MFFSPEALNLVYTHRPMESEPVSKTRPASRPIVTPRTPPGLLKMYSKSLAAVTALYLPAPYTFRQCSCTRDLILFLATSNFVSGNTKWSHCMSLACCKVVSMLPPMPTETPSGFWKKNLVQLLSLRTCKGSPNGSVLGC